MRNNKNIESLRWLRFTIKITTSKVRGIWCANRELFTFTGVCVRMSFVKCISHIYINWMLLYGKIHLDYLHWRLLPKHMVTTQLVTEFPISLFGIRAIEMKRLWQITYIWFNGCDFTWEKTFWSMQNSQKLQIPDEAFPSFTTYRYD